LASELELSTLRVPTAYIIGALFPRRLESSILGHT
jgi:hypothetical protein